MSAATNILIVEDQFVEAYSIRLILENAGYTVTAITASVEEALESIQKDKPDIALLDIYLQTKLTGIDLAKILTEKAIPFIYLSANSNLSVLEAAKATQPYGFLVKPFRETDILIALDIANYRYRREMDLIEKQGAWLNSLLSNIKPQDTDYESKLLQLIKTFRPYLPFDYAIIDLNTNSESPKTLYGFKRRDFDEYSIFNGWDVMENLRLSFGELNAWRQRLPAATDLSYSNQQDFKAITREYILASHLHQLYDLNSALFIPAMGDNNTPLRLSFFNTSADSYTTEHLRLLNPLRPLVTQILSNILGLKAETKQAAPAAPTKTAIPNIIGRSPALLQALDQIMQVADSDSTVLIMGETGVGKEAMVNTIHSHSKRKNKPLIKVNCAAIPGTLIETELFGHEKGAFTGANEKRLGKFEQAQGGTIFLDEIGEMPLEVQSRLLRVIQEREFERIGGKTTIKLDVRIIAATNRQLHKEVAAGNFRIDLYYRINVFPIIIPPLRERREDIPLLAEHFLTIQTNELGKSPKQIAPEAIQQLLQYSWPGNIRELEHLIERHALICNEPVIARFYMPEPDDPLPLPVPVVEQPVTEDEKAHIVAVLKQTNGKISGKGGAAELLNLPPSTLTYKMKKLGIRWSYPTN